MKRVGHLFERVVDRENLKLAFWKASRGKRCRPDQRMFQMNLDNFVIWSNDKDVLKRAHAEVRASLAELGLSLNDHCAMGRTSKGMNFLGRNIRKGFAVPSHKSRNRFQRTTRRLEWRCAQGKMTEEELQVRVTAMIAVVKGNQFGKRTKGSLAHRASSVAAVGGMPQQIAAPQGGTAMTPGMGGTTTASALLARSTAGMSDGPRRFPVSALSEQIH